MLDSVIPTAIVVGMAHLLPLVLIVYLGIFRSRDVVPSFRTLTAWGLASVLAIDLLRRAVYWIAKGVGYDIGLITQSTELVLSMLVALVVLLLFVIDERLNGDG